MSAGTTSLVVMADTHLPRRARDLPPALWAAVEAADLVVHAGDWVEVALLDELEQRSQALLGCYGNNDGPALRERLPLVGAAVVGGLRLAVVHETGPSSGRERRADADHPGTDVLFFGHSHIPWDTTTAAGMRLLNPGSPTDRRRQPFGSYLTAAVSGGRLADVLLHRVERPQPS